MEVKNALLLLVGFVYPMLMPKNIWWFLLVIPAMLPCQKAHWLMIMSWFSVSVRYCFHLMFIICLGHIQALVGAPSEVQEELKKFKEAFTLVADKAHFCSSMLNFYL